MRCILCDLEIPQGKANREHYLPKNRVPKYLWGNPNNIFWAHYMLNAIKSDYLPCEFWEMRYNLTYKAIRNWRMPEEDREFLKLAIDNWAIYDLDPCSLCLAKCNQRSK